MGQQSSSQSSKEMPGTAPKSGGIEATDKGLDDLKQGLVKDAGQLTGGLKDLATGVAGDAKQAVEGQLDSQKGRVVEGLGGVAHALRRVSTSGSDDEGTAIAPALVPYLQGAAERVERASQYFESKSLGEVARDVEDFARREPAFFLGGAFALGLLGGRFLKASQPASTSYAGGQSRGRSGQQGHLQQRGERSMGGSLGPGQLRHESGDGQNRHGNGNSRSEFQGASLSGTDSSSSRVGPAAHWSNGGQSGEKASASVARDGSNAPIANGGQPAKDGHADGKSGGGKPVGA